MKLRILIMLLIVTLSLAFTQSSNLGADVEAAASPVAGQLSEVDKLEVEAELLRLRLAQPGLEQEFRINTSMQLIDLLLQQAQHEKTNRIEFHSEVQHLIDQLLPLARKEQNYLAIARSLQSSWLMQFQQNKLDASGKLLLEAMQYLELAGVSEDEKVSFYSQLSYTFIVAGDYQRAITYLRHNVVWSMETGDELELAVHLYNIGDAYLKMGELAVARRYFEQSIAPFSSGETREFFTADTKLATIQRLSGHPGIALKRHQDVYQYFSEFGGYRAVPALIEIARDLLDLGNYSDARRYAGRALSDERIFTEQKLDAHLVLMHISRLEEKTDEVISQIKLLTGLFDESFEITGSIYVHPLRQLQFAEQAVEYYKQTGNQQRVIAFGEMGLGVFEHIKNGLRSSRSNYLAWASRAEPFVSQYIAALFVLDRAQILDVLEAVYSSSLMLGFDTTPDGARQVSDDLGRLEGYLSSEMAVIDALGVYEEDQSASNRTLLVEARTQRDQFRERYLATQIQNTPVLKAVMATQKQTIRQVPEGVLFLRYYTSDDLSFVIAKDSNSEIFQALPGRKTVKNLVSQVVADMGVVGVDVRSGILSELASILPADQIRRGNYHRVIFVPDDVTHQLPFSAININPQSLTYMPLGETVEVLRTYSIYGYQAGRSAPKQTNHSDSPDIVIFADPVFSSALAMQNGTAVFRNWSQSLQRLPYTAQEAEAISKIYPENSITTYLGSEATSQALLSEGSRSAQVLHIATHGYYNQSTPDIVGIATSALDTEGNNQRGFLGLTELFGHSFKSNLVVISGCETMLGRSYRGLGVQGLSQGFIAQGAGAVLGTLWKVPDQATSEFMQIFYLSLLLNNGNASTALLATRQKLINSASYSGPSFWSAFALTSSSANVDQNVFQ